MRDSGEILVIIDPTVRSQPALDQAVILAESLDKPLELFITTHQESLSQYRTILGNEVIKSGINVSLDNLVAQLEKLAKPLRNRGLKVNCDVTWDRPIDEGIVRKALQSKPFLIVKDTHYHPKLARSILRNTDWSLIRTCPFPVLFIKHKQPWKTPTVLASINPINEIQTDLDINIIKFSKLLENKMQANCKLLHVYESRSGFNINMNMLGHTEKLETSYQSLCEMHQNRVNFFADKQKVDRDKVIFMQGDIKQLLPRLVCDKKVDLVMMGSVSKSRIVQAFIGGTTEAVLDELECDILAIKSPLFETPVSAKSPPEYPAVVWPRI